MTANTLTTLPFNRLVLSPKNVRATKNTQGIEALAKSILAQGLLQNLVVTSGDHAVVAGGRRYRALAMLVSEGKVSPEFAVPVKIVDEIESTSASLTENVSREAMHPADEFAAFLRLTNEGWSVDRIADAFGVTPLVVERRLRLADAAPALMLDFTNNAISTDQLIALCTTEDHERQVAVWQRLRGNSWQCTPAALRKAVLGTQIDASEDPRVEFIGGLSAYVEAGGIVHRDLFSEDGKGGVIEDDDGLLDQLVGVKLTRIADELRQQGWGWVEVWTEMDPIALRRLGHVPSVKGELPVEAQARLDELDNEEKQLTEEYEQLDGDAQDVTEFDQAKEQRLEVIYERQNAIDEEVRQIEKTAAVYAPEVMASAGALVIFQRGQARIERGLVRAADRKAVVEATGDKAAVLGGRETESAGRKADELSDALRRSLLGRRNLAAQMETAKNPTVARVLLGCWTVQRIRGTSDYGRGTVPMDLTLSEGGSDRGTRTRHPISDAEGAGKASRWAKACAEKVAKLPNADDALWDALAAMKPADLDSIIAHGVGLSVSLDSELKGLTGKFLAALTFEMAGHFAPTADNYLGRVPKALILQALAEAGKVTSAADKSRLETMKKGELAAEAERRMVDSGWVPAVIRTQQAKQAVAKAKKRK